MSKSILYDATLCIDCKACEEACAKHAALAYDEKVAAQEYTSSHKLTAVLNKILNGQIGTVLNQLENGGLPSLGNRSNPHSSLYGQPNGYQGARSVRLGLRFTF